MENRKKQKNKDFDVEIGLKHGKEWSNEELAKVKAFAKDHAEKRTPARKLKNEMLSVKYRMEDYVNTERVAEKNILSLESFLWLYLNALNLTLKKFALSIDTTDGNLKKYLSGDRRFSTDLAFKFASFFHTTPDLWMNVSVKNELIELKFEKKQAGKYKKYDFEKVLA